jgi:hypothetical protein
MEPAERRFELVRDFQLKSKGFFLSCWIFREKRMLDGQCWFGPMFLVLFGVSGKNLWPVWLSWPLSIGSSLVRGLVRRFGSWRCSCPLGVV